MRKLIISLAFLLCISSLIFAQNLKTASGKNILKQNHKWYASKEAKTYADNILLYQSDKGAWPKNMDITIAPESNEILEKAHKGKNSNTIDNGATTAPIHYLAFIISTRLDVKYQIAFYKGLDYLFESQYDNGGWPQFYPLRKGYYTAITYNDNAMMNVMKLLNKIAQGKDEFAIVEPDYKKKAAEAIKKGIDCILKTQIKQDGKLTAWCAQHDEVNFEPVWARNFEPPSLSGAESVNIVQFLMQIEDPSKEVIEAIQGAIEWFKQVQINNVEFTRFKNDEGEKDAKIKTKKGADPLWARFYELETNKPLFVGRDKVFHYTFAEVERERRAGYAYYGKWPSKLINKQYPEWLKKHHLE
nr:pectate lyase [uncultured Carboxylicivirga sp.]